MTRDHKNSSWTAEHACNQSSQARPEVRFEGSSELSDSELAQVVGGASFFEFEAGSASRFCYLGRASRYGCSTFGF